MEDAKEVGDCLSVWSLLRPLWHPTTSDSSAFDTVCERAASLGECTHVAATLSELQALQASRPPNASLAATSSSRAHTLGSKSAVFSSLYNACAEAARVVGQPVLAGAVLRLAALSQAMHARHTSLILALLEELLERDRERAQREREALSPLLEKLQRPVGGR